MLMIGAAIFGWLSDRTSSRSVPFLGGLLMLGAGTLLLCLANKAYWVVASRTLQGLSASIVFTVGLALLSDTVDRKDIGQFIGYFQLSSNIGILISPLIGGVVYAKAGYYAVFAIMFALILTDIFLRLFLIERKDRVKYIPLSQEIPNDDLGTKDQTPGQPDSNWQATQREPQGSSKDRSRNSATEEPPTDNHTPKAFPLITLLKSPRLLTAVYGIFINYALVASFDGVLPSFVQRTFGWTSLGAGLIFLCIALPTLLSPLVGALSDKYGPRWFAVCGLLLPAPFLVLLRLITHEALDQVVLLCVLLSMIGTSASYYCSLCQNAQMQSFPDIYRDYAYADDAAIGGGVDICSRGPGKREARCIRGIWRVRAGVLAIHLCLGRRNDACTPRRGNPRGENRLEDHVPVIGSVQCNGCHTGGK